MISAWCPRPHPEWWRRRAGGRAECPLRLGPSAEAWCDGDGRLSLTARPLLHRDELRIPGDHNVENALAAALLARHGGADLEAIREGLRTYPGLAHRIAFCGEKGGVKAYNDSKGTNVDATLTAIKALPGPLVLLLGGTGQGRQLRAPARRPWRASCAAWSSWARRSRSSTATWATCPTTWCRPSTRPCGPPSPWRGPATRCCSAPPAPASTSSTTSSSAASASRPWCGPGSE